MYIRAMYEWVLNVFKGSTHSALRFNVSHVIRLVMKMDDDHIRM